MKTKEFILYHPAHNDVPHALSDPLNLIADHVSAVMSFTTEQNIDGQQIPDQRIGIIVTLDGATAKRGATVGQPLIVTMFEKFHELMCEMCGHQAVNIALLEQMLSRIEASEEDEITERDNAPLH